MKNTKQIKFKKQVKLQIFMCGKLNTLYLYYNVHITYINKLYQKNTYLKMHDEVNCFNLFDKAQVWF